MLFTKYLIEYGTTNDLLSFAKDIVKNSKKEQQIKTEYLTLMFIRMCEMYLDNMWCFIIKQKVCHIESLSEFPIYLMELEYLDIFTGDNNERFNDFCRVYYKCYNKLLNNEILNVKK